MLAFTMQVDNHILKSSSLKMICWNVNARLSGWTALAPISTLKKDAMQIE